MPGVKDGNTITITFYIVIEDGYGVHVDSDLYLAVVDEELDGDSEVFNVNYDYIMV